MTIISGHCVQSTKAVFAAGDELNLTIAAPATPSAAKAKTIFVIPTLMILLTPSDA
jgi:hypothetical protein